MLAEAVHGCFYAGDTPAMLAAAARAVALAAVAADAPRDVLRAMAQGIALVADGQGEAGAAAVRARRRDPRGARRAARRPAPAHVGGARPDVAARGRCRPRADRPRVRAGAARRARSAACRGSCTISPATRRRPTGGRRPRRATTRRSGWRARPGSATELGAALAGLAWLEARQGREDACRAHADAGGGALRRARDRRSTGSGRSRRSATSSSASAGRPRRSSTTRRRPRRCARSGSPTSTSRPRPSWSRPTCGSGAARTRRPRRREFVAARRGQGAAVGAGARGALPRAARRGRRARGRVRGGARAARADARTSSRRRARGWRTGRGCGARGSACARASSCARRSSCSSALGAQPWADQARRRAGGDGRDRAAARREHARRPDAAGAPDRAAARRRARRRARRPRPSS